MAFSVKDPETDRAVRRLARLKNLSLTETIRAAVDAEFVRLTGEQPLVDRLERLAGRYRAYPACGVDADKAFFDDLSGGT